MNRKMERPIFIRDIDPVQDGSTLVVGINRKGNIVRFNDTLEHLTGSSKKDVLDIPFSTYFSRQIPEEDLVKLIHQARFSPDSVDVDTTFKTISGENVVISWTGFAIKNEEDGQVSQLNLVGTPQKNSVESKSNKTNKTTKKQPTTKTTSKKEKKNESDKKDIEHKINQIKNSKDSKNKSQIETAAEEKKKNNKKEEKSEKSSSKTNKRNITSVKKTDNTKGSKKKIKLKKRTKKPTNKKVKPEKVEIDEVKEIIEENDEPQKPSSDCIKKPFSKFLSKKEKREKSKKISKFPSLKKSPSLKKADDGYDGEPEKITLSSLQKKINQLEKENKHLSKEKNQLEEKLHSAEFNKEKIKKFVNTKFSFIRNSIAIKKKREEFKEMMQQLSERKQKLEKLETEMVLEKKEFKQKIQEFVNWREKLEKLEDEIEKRRQFLSEQETFLNQQYDKVLSHELEQPAVYTQNIEQKQSEDTETKEGIVEKDDLFNSLTVEAAVLQRGRIKKANKRLAQMLGYSEKELVGKHLVDFVGPTGLSGVEQHYMNRLKGVDDASYSTVFLSKDENEIPVNVHVKNGDFHGERAEIATFNEL